MSGRNSNSGGACLAQAAEKTCKNAGLRQRENNVSRHVELLVYNSVSYLRLATCSLPGEGDRLLSSTSVVACILAEQHS